MNEFETEKHVGRFHQHMLPECFLPARDVTWHQVHNLVTRLAPRKGAPVHVDQWYPEDYSEEWKR